MATLTTLRPDATPHVTPALPAWLRLITSTPPSAAATTGQVPVGPSASLQWLMELPWCTQRRSPSGSGAGTSPSARSATSSVGVCCGSHNSTSFMPAGSPANRTVPGSPPG